MQVLELGITVFTDRVRVRVRVKVRDAQGTKRMGTNRLGYEMSGNPGFLIYLTHLLVFTLFSINVLFHYNLSTSKMDLRTKFKQDNTYSFARLKINRLQIVEPVCPFTYRVSHKTPKTFCNIFT